MKVTAHPYESLPVLILTGVGRSGTTVLRHSISAHPDVHSTETENNIIHDVLETARHNCTFPSRKGTMHVAQPAYDRQFRLLLLNLLWPSPRRGSERPGMLVASSDLSPERAEYFLQCFPGGRIACIVRNGIAVVSSRMKHPNFCEVPFEKHCEAWTNAAAMKDWGAGRPEFGLVRQEALLDENTARTSLEALLEKIGLPFSDACLKVVNENQYHPTEEAGENAGQDLAGREERWQSWTEAQRDTFNRICSDAMTSLEYSVPWLD